MQQRLSNEPVAVIADDITDVSLGVWVSFAEIYNENVYDLLTPQPLRGQSRQKLRLGHCDGNAYIKDLKYINVTSGLQAYHLMQFGLQNLKYAATCVNEHSSRSHSIFTIKLAQASDTKEGVSVSSFNFCDLAGSERLNKTHNKTHAVKAFKDLELQYDSSMKELKKRVVQQQDEINILTTYCENCHLPSESVSSDNVSVSLPPSEIDLEEITK